MGLRGPKPGGKKGGRQKGTPNKLTVEVKTAIERAFQHLEEPEDDFNKWAKDNRTIFYTQLLPKIIPLQLNHAGADGGELEITWRKKGS